MDKRKRPPGVMDTQADPLAQKKGQNRLQGQYSTRRAEMQDILLSCLRYGQENAVHSRYLSSVTGFDGATVREHVSALRLCGKPIVSGVDGYWLSDSRSELRRCARSLDRRAKRIHNAAAAVWKASRKSVRP